jgi:chitin disaccharide deacetylase
VEASAERDAPEIARDAAGRRKIWLCADDYGIAPGVNSAIRDLIVRNRLNATSVMVVAPSFDRSQAAALDSLNSGGKRAAIGLHLTLTGPFRPQISGFAPLEDGAFPPILSMMRRAVLRRLDPAALSAEIKAQLAAFVAAFGHAPDFVDGHQHVHLFPQVRDALLDAVKKAAPEAWVRQCYAGNASDVKGRVLNWFSRAFVRRARAAGVKVNPAFAGTYAFTDTADFAALFPRFLAGLPEGGLVMCHPGTVDAELERLDPLTTLREHEYAYLRDDAFPLALAAAGVALAEAGGGVSPR